MGKATAYGPYSLADRKVLTTDFPNLGNRDRVYPVIVASNVWLILVEDTN